MKKYITTFVGIVCLIFAGTSCRQQDNRTLIINVPEMRNEACVRVIAASLWTSPGIKRKEFHPRRKNDPVPFEYLLSDSVTFNISRRQVTVVYDSLLTADKNIEFRIAKAGFAANDIPADKKAAAALPPECRR
jgi:copper chaperone CopZ